MPCILNFPVWLLEQGVTIELERIKKILGKGRSFIEKQLNGDYVDARFRFQ